MSRKRFFAKASLKATAASRAPAEARIEVKGRSHSDHIDVRHTARATTSGNVRKRVLAIAAIGALASATFIGSKFLPNSEGNGESHRYPAPPAEGTLRLMYEAQIGDNRWSASELLAKQMEERLHNANLHTVEIHRNMYEGPASSGEPQANMVPPTPGNGTVEPGELLISDIPVKDVYDKPN